MTSGKQSKAERSERQAKIDAAAPKPSKAKPILVALVVIAVIAGIGAAVFFGNRSTAPDQAATGNANSYPKGATGPTGGIVVNADKVKAGAPTLDIYEDFQCPACEQLEKAVGPTITQMGEAGEVKVVYHIKNFLDANLGNDSSTRAGNAAACAADVGAFQAYHDQVYAHPPAKEGDGYTDAQLEQFATGAGISGANLVTWKKCVADKKYDAYIKGVDEATAKAGVNSTPTLQVNGKTFDLAAQKVTSAQDFRTKVLAAGK